MTADRWWQLFVLRSEIYHSNKLPFKKYTTKNKTNIGHTFNVSKQNKKKTGKWHVALKILDVAATLRKTMNKNQMTLQLK